MNFLRSKWEDIILWKFFVSSVVVAKPFDVFKLSIWKLLPTNPVLPIIEVIYSYVPSLLKRACLIELKGGFSFALLTSFMEQVYTPVNQACNLIEVSYPVALAA